jgi:hypothetical protein
MIRKNVSALAHGPYLMQNLLGTQFLGSQQPHCLTLKPVAICGTKYPIYQAKKTVKVPAWKF